MKEKPTGSQRPNGFGRLAPTESKLPIDKVTPTNLDIALRMCGIQIDKTLLDRIIDVVELIEEKGDDVSIKDVAKLKAGWETPTIPDDMIKASVDHMEAILNELRYGTGVKPLI